jgi:high-affinity iron transporter
LALTNGQLLGVAAIAFIAVFREEIETVLLLTAVFFVYRPGTTIGILVGLIAVAAVFGVVMKSSYRLNLHSFFKYTSMILLVFAAGLVSFAAHELAETSEALGVNMGILGQQAFNFQVATSSMFNEEGSLGSVLSTLFGYTLSPEWIRLAVFLGYWRVIGGYLAFTYRDFAHHAIRAT